MQIHISCKFGNTSNIIALSLCWIPVFTSPPTSPVILTALSKAACFSLFKPRIPKSPVSAHIESNIISFQNHIPFCGWSWSVVAMSIVKFIISNPRDMMKYKTIAKRTMDINNPRTNSFPSSRWNNELGNDQSIWLRVKKIRPTKLQTRITE